MAADLLGGERAHVRAVEGAYPFVDAQRPRQLAVADVDGDHLPCAAAEQDVGEAAGGGTRVEAAPALDRDPGERVKSAGQLVTAAGDVTGAVWCDLDDQGGTRVDRGGRLAGGPPGDPDQAGVHHLGGLLPGPGQPAAD